MKKIFVIAGRELKLSFSSAVAYWVIAGFVLLAGFFFFGLLTRYNALVEQAAIIPNMVPSLNLWIVIPFLRTLQVILLFVVPLLVMRLFAEERQLGTFELLVTSPLAMSEVVLGKYLASIVVVTVMLSLSFMFPLALVIFADPELLPILIGLSGILFYGWALTALALGISTFFRSQTVCGFISVVFLLLLYVIDAQAGKLDSRLSLILSYLSPAEHLELSLKGVATGQDLIYFLSLIAVGLFVANRVLEGERWR